MLAQSLSNAFKAGQCDQFCKMLPGALYSGGRWIVEEKVCRCHNDFTPSEMGIIQLPHRIKKTNKESDEL